MFNGVEDVNRVPKVLILSEVNKTPPSPVLCVVRICVRYEGYIHACLAVMGALLGICMGVCVCVCVYAHTHTHARLLWIARLL